MIGTGLRLMREQATQLAPVGNLPQLWKIARKHTGDKENITRTSRSTSSDARLGSFVERDARHRLLYVPGCTQLTPGGLRSL